MSTPAIILLGLGLGVAALFLVVVVAEAICRVYWWRRAKELERHEDFPWVSYLQDQAPE